MKYLFIAEKPSLMRSVKSCYQNHKAEVRKAVGEIDFLALSGHVCCFAEPKDYKEWDCAWHALDYPIVPKYWKVKAIQDKQKQSVLAKIRNNAANYDGFIVGTDSDQEGYGIYYLLENYLGIQNHKALRFMEHSLTDQEILKSLLSMTDYHTDSVHVRFTQAFLLRSKADWLYGMNSTRLMTLKTGELMTVGRVKAPTLKLVYDNSMAINEFRPQKYYLVSAAYPGFVGIRIGEDGKPIIFGTRKEAEAEQITKSGVITEIQKQTKKSRAPKLYDLTSLQGDAGQILGLTPSQTLETVQSLYEKHKVISYPRTQCRYVSSEKAKEFPDMLKKMSVFPELAGFVKQITKNDIERVNRDKMVVNDAEIAKESHDALLPTSKTPVLSDMTEQEQNVCRLIYTRLLAQFLPPLAECKTKMIIQHGNATFLVQGKVVEDQGWRRLYGEAKSRELPELKKGAAITADAIEPVEKTTTPPKRLTQTSLVLAMQNIANHIEDPELKKTLAESHGIGTSSTRASIVTDLIKHGYIKDQKGLYITDLGKRYIEQMKDINLCSPVFAAKMDMEIKKIQRGEADYTEVYKQMLGGLSEVCQQIKQIHCSSGEICPCCGADLQISGYYFKCPSCGASIKRQICGQRITSKVLETLRKNGITESLPMVSREGKHFSARIKLQDGQLVLSYS